MGQIESVYGEVNNLAPFIHPKFNRGFRFLSSVQQIELAGRCVDEMVRSGYDQIVASESGSSPFIYLCRRIARQKGLQLKWFMLKVPREPLRNIYPLLMYHLSESEKNETLSAEKIKMVSDCLHETKGVKIEQNPKSMTRSEMLKVICTIIPECLRIDPDLNKILTDSEGLEQTTAQELIVTLLEGTAFSNIFSKPFLYFDEYFNSGTTLLSAKYHFNFFAKKPVFKIGTYFIYLHGSNRFDKIAFSLFDLDSELECFSFGAYPFENRVDLIGHYFFIDEEEYSKIELSALYEESAGQKSNNTGVFIDELRTVLSKNKLLEVLEQNSAVPLVRDFLDENHLIRHYLTLFEAESFGMKKHYEFLSQLSEMYGPIWSPLPKENHLDFWHAFEKIEGKIRGIPEFEDLKEQYLACRQAIFRTAAKVCIGRRNEWLDEINGLLGGKNEI